MVTFNTERTLRLGYRRYSEPSTLVSSHASIPLELRDGVCHLLVTYRVTFTHGRLDGFERIR